ncbi:MAG: lytic transglycosylase domain-containing protein [Desulfobulbaceae bacterium]|jgi:membrane-bound lytic murein transglycosylase D|nr:lytic transglycosylase domain-containing protein [Desulfobulbaceae bacterium]
MPSPHRQAALLLVALLLLRALPALAEEHFPLYESIRPNVAFWEKIYGSVSENTSLLHDRRDLSLVYGSVTLWDKNAPGATAWNKTRLEQATAYYKDMLTRLSTGAQPADAEEIRIRSMFSGKNALGRMTLAADNIRSQRGMKERFRAGVIRSGAYMPEIQKIFLGYGLPPELSYLPHVESSFTVEARSKVGATGIWQFTRSTGQDFLNINEAVDERLDPILAADAAARYLSDNHSKLQSWPLSLTAYNYGANGMMRAKNALGDYERIFREYEEGYFKFAARNFYSEFLAAVRVAKRLENDPSLALHQPPLVKRHVVARPSYISEIERVTGVNRDELRRHNPALLPPALSGKKPIPSGHALRLPLNRGRFAARETPRQTRAGETAAAKRHNISLSQLMRAK